MVEYSNNVRVKAAEILAAMAVGAVVWWNRRKEEVSVGRILDTDVSASKSPKRQSLSVYERVKSKVSRSLSNGSVIHKKYTQPRRPSSLLLHPTDTISNLVHVWSCARCTLYNSGETSRCEVCETPRKSTIPVSSPGHSLPRSSMVITVPDWDKTRSSDHLWVQPMYRRSEFLSNEVVKSENKDNLKELVDEGTQEKCSIVHSSVSNLNVQLISGKSSDITTRYSYIGISKPGEYPAMTTTPTTGHGLPNSATDPVDLKNVFCLKPPQAAKLHTHGWYKPPANLRGRGSVTHGLLLMRIIKKETVQLSQCSVSTDQVGTVIDTHRGGRPTPGNNAMRGSEESGGE
uniref:RanBP2-type domain-containing protein n=1 Tax=Rhodnius prolixus TaxID=13249 RepID=T1I3G1_RHOPR